MATHWALIDSRKRIRATGKTKKACVDNAQGIINRGGSRFRYVRINVDPKMPWFKKGE